MTALILLVGLLSGFLYKYFFFIITCKLDGKSMKVFFSNIKRKSDNEANRRGHSIYSVKNKQSKFYVFVLNQKLLFSTVFTLFVDNFWNIFHYTYRLMRPHYIFCRV